MATPGQVVGVGKLITPGGQQGPKGDTGTVPAVSFYNAIGNPNFEVDQRNVGNTVNPVSGTGAFAQDRWFVGMSGTMTVTAGQKTEAVLIPATNFQISSKFLRVTLTAQEASMAQFDSLRLVQNVEGPQGRSLVSNVTSLSFLVRSSVAGLIFGAVLLDNGGGYTIGKLCTIPAANVWTLIQLPNLPVYPGANWLTAAGSLGYNLFISLACGSNVSIAAPNVWANTGTKYGVSGQGNFAASTVGSTFDIAFVQHESGPTCSTLIDKPFSQNLIECQRYFAKSNSYPTAPGTATTQNEVFFYCNNPNLLAMGFTKFPVTMAKQPTATIYNSVTGAINSCQEYPSATARAVAAGTVSEGDSGISYFQATSLASGQMVRFQYIVDTGW